MILEFIGFIELLAVSLITSSSLLISRLMIEL